MTGHRSGRISNLGGATLAPDQRARRDRNYTLFEYLFGLGQLLSAKFPTLFKPVAVDQPSPVGFNLVSACLRSGVADKDLRQLPAAIGSLSLTALERCLLESVTFVHDLLQPILAPQRRGQAKPPYIHADAQILSMIASAFQVRYHALTLSELAGWREHRAALSVNLPMFFLFETLRENWSGSGDATLREILQNQLYLTAPPTQSRWLQELDIWFDLNLKRRIHRRSYIKDSYPEYLLLRYIFAQRLANAPCFVAAHIVPAARLTSPECGYSAQPGPINSIGNLALVPDDQYQDMGEQTFVEYLQSRRRAGAIGGPAAFAEARAKVENQLVCRADMLPSPLSRPAFEAFLVQRFQLLKSEFVRVWRDHMPAQSAS